MRIAGVSSTGNFAVNLFYAVRVAGRLSTVSPSPSKALRRCVDSMGSSNGSNPWFRGSYPGRELFSGKQDQSKPRLVRRGVAKGGHSLALTGCLSGTRSRTSWAPERFHIGPNRRNLHESNVCAPCSSVNALSHRRNRRERAENCGRIL